MKCKKCDGKTIKYGFSIQSNGKVQRYVCTECGHVFVEPMEDVNQMDIDLLDKIRAELYEEIEKISIKICKEYDIEIPFEELQKISYVDFSMKYGSGA